MNQISSIRGVEGTYRASAGYYYLPLPAGRCRDGLGKPSSIPSQGLQHDQSPHVSRLMPRINSQPETPGRSSAPAPAREPLIHLARGYSVNLTVFPILGHSLTRGSSRVFRGLPALRRIASENTHEKCISNEIGAFGAPLA